ncbi:hypothetical protein DUNSADRAFT_7082 [Dunaliella salina]|uniref:Uncharacterized protein n=1 Tax=Dunaliella salina TaxID=3046 RepID=A0ABQ7H6H7_DUNSA|nr:hypothetical protein DUNSADRAFT_7082 [Dunaliella salina]|eukprot:KAF5842472.1 hypothetical protein DUNSADRAFT_7082 [Dunaliella salina]
MQSARRLGPCLLRCTMQAAGASRTESACCGSILNSLSVSEPSYSHQQIQSCNSSIKQHHRGLSTSTHALGPQEQLGSAFSLVFDSLGARVWEAGHSLTNLPWWASIPATALAVKGLLLPLSIKARAASINVVLLNSAFTQASLLAQRVKPGDARVLGYLALVRAIYAQLCVRHSAPSLAWYIPNMVVQAATFSWLTSSLNTMCASVWPGFDSEGILYFKDLTNPPVFLETLSTPYGSAGAVLPLALVLLYARTLSSSLAVRGAPGVNTALQLMMVPFYCVSLIQPHATLLFWASSLGGQLALQASRLGRPPLLAPAAQQSSFSSLQSESPSRSISSKDTLPHSEMASEVDAARMPAAGQSLGPEAASRGTEGGQDAWHGAASATSQEQGEGDPLEALQLPITQDRSLLTGLGDYYVARGRREAAAVCYGLATKLARDSADGPPRKEALENFKLGLQHQVKEESQNQ